MGNGFGIAAFVLLLVSLVIPVLGNYLSLFAVLLLCGAAYARNKPWTIAVDLIAWVKMFMLSPTWHIMMFSGGYMKSVNQSIEQSGHMAGLRQNQMESSARDVGNANTFVLLLTIAILTAPLAILIWRSMTPSVPGSIDEPTRD